MDQWLESFLLLQVPITPIRWLTITCNSLVPEGLTSCSGFHGTQAHVAYGHTDTHIYIHTLK